VTNILLSDITKKEKITVCQEGSVGKDGEFDGHKVAMFSTYMGNGKMSPSVYKQIKELEINRWPVVVIDTSPESSDFDWPEWATVIRRPNDNQDWGSWAYAIHNMPGLLRAKTLLQMNDSMVGPFYPMGGLLRLMDSDDADYVGLTDNPEIDWHLSAMFVSYCNNSIKNPVFRLFWNGIKSVETRSEHVFKHEIPLSKVAINGNLKVKPIFTYLDVDVDYAPLTFGAKKLLEIGCPLIKRRTVQWLPDKAIEYAKLYGQEAVDMVKYALDEKLT